MNWSAISRILTLKESLRGGFDSSKMFFFYKNRTSIFPGHGVFNATLLTDKLDDHSMYRAALKAGIWYSLRISDRPDAGSTERVVAVDRSQFSVRLALDGNGGPRNPREYSATRCSVVMTTLSVATGYRSKFVVHVNRSLITCRGTGLVW